MKWMDPLSVKCEECGKTEFYSVEGLKNLSAACIQCGKSLSVIGENMIKEECRVSAYYQIMMLILDIEEKLDIEYNDEEIEPVENLTIAKILNRAEKKIDVETGVHATIMEAVNSILKDARGTIDDNCELYQLFLNKLFLSANLGIDADS
jgi:uncharacterized ubiquitin-like protein YukD